MITLFNFKPKDESNTPSLSIQSDIDIGTNKSWSFFLFRKEYRLPTEIDRAGDSGYTSGNFMIVTALK